MRWPAKNAPEALSDVPTAVHTRLKHVLLWLYDESLPVFLSFVFVGFKQCVDNYISIS